MYLGFQPANIFYQASAAGNSPVFDMGDVFGQFTITMTALNTVTEASAEIYGSLDQVNWYELWSTPSNWGGGSGTSYWGPYNVTGTLARYIKGSIFQLIAGSGDSLLTICLAAR